MKLSIFITISILASISIYGQQSTNTIHNPIITTSAPVESSFVLVENTNGNTNNDAFENKRIGSKKITSHAAVASKENFETSGVDYVDIIPEDTKKLELSQERQNQKHVTLEATPTPPTLSNIWQQ